MIKKIKISNFWELPRGIPCVRNVHSSLSLDKLVCASRVLCFNKNKKEKHINYQISK